MDEVTVMLMMMTMVSDYDDGVIMQFKYSTMVSKHFAIWLTYLDVKIEKVSYKYKYKKQYI